MIQFGLPRGMAGKMFQMENESEQRQFLSLVKRVESLRTDDLGPSRFQSWVNLPQEPMSEVPPACAGNCKLCETQAIPDDKILTRLGVTIFARPVCTVVAVLDRTLRLLQGQSGDPRLA
ncbi:hypothetical protein CYMTET_56778 [Cymbomonas tetramitiformis]|uniref:Uncharacterized protein n=1 Tax=Cymbomonas tetramitiformis TaxID=36881 RepID=A0AAE0EM84_9CHLO|nr:hypothetical protein CYMTET_56778 [Cymbomonas tetramitiformis]